MEYFPIIPIANLPQPNPAPQPAMYALPPDFITMVRQLVHQIALAEQCRADAVIANDDLSRRLAEKQAKEDAYRTVEQKNGCIVTRSGTARSVELLSHEIKWAVHLKAHPPFTLPATYVVKVDGVEPELILSERDYLRDNVFLQSLEELPGVKVGFVCSAKRTATLLRQAINAKIQTITPAFWGGWFRAKGGNYHFTSFQLLQPTPTGCGWTLSPN